MSELEIRRRAIAEALREVMAEPPVTAPAEPLPIPHVPLALVHDPVEESDEIDSELTDDLDPGEDRDDGSTTPAIPPLEPIGAMSPAASRALFGHH